MQLKARSEGGATGDGETSGEITQQVAVYLEMREVGDEPEPAPTDGGGASPNTDRNDTDDNHTSVDDDMTLNEGDGRCPNGNAGDTGVTFERPGTGEMSKTTEPHDGFKAEVSRVEGTNKPLAGEGVRASEGIGNLNLDDDVVKSEERVLEAVGAMVSALGADADADEDEVWRQTFVYELQRGGFPIQNKSTRRYFQCDIDQATFSSISFRFIVLGNASFVTKKVGFTPRMKERRWCRNAFGIHSMKVRHTLMFFFSFTHRPSSYLHGLPSCKV